MTTAAAPNAPATLARLTRDARAVAASVTGVLGIEPDDLVSAGWLAYVDAADRGLGHAGCAARAKYAMLDTVRAWIGTPWDHKTGARLVQLVPLPETVTATDSRAGRTRLPRPVRRALRTLPDTARRALHCWTVRGWSHELIAAHLGISVGTSGRLRHEALAQLRAVAGRPSDRRRDVNSSHERSAGPRPARRRCVASSAGEPLNAPPRRREH